MLNKIAFMVMIVMVFISCQYSEINKHNPDILFNPIPNNDTLIYRQETVDGVSMIVFYSKNSGEELIRLSRFDLGNVFLDNESKTAYFVIIGEQPNRVDWLWKVDSTQGRATPLLETNPSVMLTSDRLFACHEDLKTEEKNNSNYPLIQIIDLEKCVVIRNIKYNNPLYENCSSEISYDNINDCFVIEMILEGESKGVEKIYFR